jgi:hypothetical protein
MARDAEGLSVLFGICTSGAVASKGAMDGSGSDVVDGAVRSVRLGQTAGE